MKRFVGWIMVLCLLFSLAAEAVAEPNWEITEQTKCTTTKKSVTLSVKVKGKGIKYQWVFVNPENPDDTVTGKNLSKRFSGIKVKGYAKSKIVLTKVPEELHGWTAYCHLYANAYKMDSDPVAIAVYGLEPPEQPEKPEAPAKEDASSKEDTDEGGDEDEEEEAVSAAPSEFTVTINGKYLYKVDPAGNAEEGSAASSLTFSGTGSVAIRTEEPFKAWTVNGVRYELEDEITGFTMSNLSSDTSVSLKTAVKTAASAKVDESVSCSVTCKGCSFTYMPKGLKSAKEGQVPSGAVIYVFADSSEIAANGYTINGGEAQNLGASSMQLTITEDTEIVVK